MSKAKQARTDAEKASTLYETLLSCGHGTKLDEMFQSHGGDRQKFDAAVAAFVAEVTKRNWEEQ